MKKLKENILLFAKIGCVMITLAMGVACNDEGIIVLDDYIVKDTTISLTGTKWKLVGFYNIEKNEIKVPPDLTDCECYYTLEFNEPCYFYVVYPTNENFKPNFEKDGMSNDEELNKIFKEFCVIKYNQQFPGADNIELENTYTIYLSGDGDSFEVLLKEKNFFEKIYRSGSYVPGNYPSPNTRIRGVINLLGIYCSVDYTFSTIKFEMNSVEVYEKEYFDAFCNAQTFELKNNELKIYYNDNNNYLLFKKQLP